MENCKAPRGLIVDLITPLKKNGAIDGTGLVRLIERVAPHAQAILLAGPRHGEGESLGIDLRRELLQRALAAMAGRPMSLLIWVTGNTEIETTENILTLQKSLENNRPEGGLFWVDTPLAYHSNRGLPDFYRELEAMVKDPLVLHNDADCIHPTRPFKRRNIRTAVLKELVQLEGIAGLIFSGSLERAHHYQKACRKRPHFRLYDGDETRFLGHPSMSGVTSVGANPAPGAWGKITRSSLQLHAHRENYPDRLQQIWESGDYLSNMVALYHHAPVPIIKTILSDMGIIETPDVLQPAAFDQGAITALKELMSDFGDYD